MEGNGKAEENLPVKEEVEEPEIAKPTDEQQESENKTALKTSSLDTNMVNSPLTCAVFFGD